MSWHLMPALALVALTASTGNVAAAAPPYPPEPLRGAVVSGNILICTSNAAWVSTWFLPLKAGRLIKFPHFIAKCVNQPLRWHVGYGALWVADTWGDGSNLPVPWFEGPQRYELAELIKGRRVINPGGKPSASHGFASADPVEEARLQGISTKYHPVIYYDYLPVGQTVLKLFVLTNIARPTENARKAPIDPDLTPIWSFVCHTVRPHWDAEELRWEDNGWKQEDRIELRFREPFQALGRGKDYYFVTASGKLYRAAKPAKGKQRKLQTVWDDRRSPITAFISDVDSGKTFLFCDKGLRGNGKPCLFELASGVRLRFYDRALFKPGDQGPDQLRRVVGYARVLTALKLIKDKPAAHKKTEGKPTTRPGKK